LASTDNLISNNQKTEHTQSNVHTEVSLINNNLSLSPF